MVETVHSGTAQLFNRVLAPFEREQKKYFHTSPSATWLDVVAYTLVIAMFGHTTGVFLRLFSPGLAPLYLDT